VFGYLIGQPLLTLLPFLRLAFKEGGRAIANEGGCFIDLVMKSLRCSLTSTVPIQARVAERIRAAIERKSFSVIGQGFIKILIIILGSAEAAVVKVAFVGTLYGVTAKDFPSLSSSGHLGREKSCAIYFRPWSSKN
jgi:hypothetical protein